MVRVTDKLWRWWGSNDSVGAEPKPSRSDAGRSIYTTPVDAHVPTTLNYPSTTLSQMLDQTASRFGDAPALIYSDQRWNYRQLLMKVNRLAGGLARLGVRKGDAVLLTLPNCPEFITSFFAIQKLGAVVVNAGPLMGTDDVRSLIKSTRPRVLIGLDLQEPLFAKVVDGAIVKTCVYVSLQSYQGLFKRVGYMVKVWQQRQPVQGAERLTMAQVTENAPSRPPTVVPDVNDTAVLQPTGGTTGVLKVACLSHQNLIANAAQLSAWSLSPLGQERVLAVLPMFHVYGLTTCLLTSIFNGSALIPLTRFVPKQVVESIIQHRPTIFPLVPAICEGVSNVIERMDRPAALDSIRLCISGAAPLSARVADRFEKLTGIELIQGYGMTESSPVTVANIPGKNRPESIGVPLPDTQVRLAELDDPAVDVASGEAGELLVAGPQVMKGYFDNPEETARVLWADGDGQIWLRTGDVARVNQDGSIRIVDRIKRMIIHSGFNVYPAKVEKVLSKHELIEDVAVVGKADPVCTEQVVAMIVSKGVAKDSAEDVAELFEQLRALCREHLGRYEKPARYELVDELPRNALGKLLMIELKAQYQAITEKQLAGDAAADDGGDRNVPTAA
jgi:long-chain acyl-CoA synthetase